MEENEDYLLFLPQATEEAEKRGLNAEFLTYLRSAKFGQIILAQIEHKMKYKLKNSQHPTHILLLQAIRECYNSLQDSRKILYSEETRVVHMKRNNHKINPMDKEAMPIQELRIEDRITNQLRKENVILGNNSIFCGICSKGGITNAISRAEDFVIHNEMYHGHLMLFACQFCGNAYTTKEEYEGHDCEQYKSFKLSQSMNKEYTGDTMYGSAYLICSECGKYHILKSRLSELAALEQKNSIINHFRHHNANEIITAMVVFENQCSIPPKITFPTSLNMNVRLNCKDCKINSFTSSKERREHFASVHGFSSTIPCPHENCDFQETDKVLLKQHVLESHMKNGILGFFMKNHAAIHTSDSSRNLGFARPSQVTRKKFWGKNVLIGGVPMQDMSPRLPPQFVSKNTSTIFDVTEEVLKNLHIPKDALDLARTDSNLKISTTLFNGKGKKNGVYQNMVLDNFEMDDMNQNMIIEPEFLEDYQMSFQLSTLPNMENDKELRKKIGYCRECHRILNGSKCIKKHCCEKDRMHILSQGDTFQNRTFKCPICRETNLICSIDGLIFHMFDEHNYFCHYEEDNSEIAKIPEIKNIEETERINQVLEIESNEDIFNAFTKKESDIVVIDLDDEMPRKRKKTPQILSNEPSTSNPIPSSISPDVEDFVLQNVTERRKTSFDVAEMWMESGLNREALSASNSRGSAADSHRSSSCQTPDSLMDDPNNPLLDRALASVIIETPSSQDFQIVQQIREETQDNTPNVIHNHSVDEGEIDDDIMIVEDIANQNRERNDGESKFRPPVISKVVELHDGDDEVMAVANVFYANHAERPVSGREARFGCSKCSKKFLTESSLNNHLKIEHSTNAIDDLNLQDFGVPLTGTIFICLQCCAAFESKEKFLIHLSKHPGKAEQCNYCSGAMLHLNEKAHSSSHKEFKWSCSSCRPFSAFPSESTLLNHLAEFHNVPMIYYCKKCMMGTCSPNAIFYRHLNECFEIKPKTLLSMIGIMTATTFSYQPADMEEYKAELARHPEKFAYVTECSHRSAIRHGTSWATCPMANLDGRQCFCMISNFRLDNFKDYLKLSDVETTDKHDFPRVTLHEKFWKKYDNVTKRKGNRKQTVNQIAMQLQTNASRQQNNHHVQQNVAMPSFQQAAVTIQQNPPNVPPQFAQPQVPPPHRNNQLQGTPSNMPMNIQNFPPVPRISLSNNPPAQLVKLFSESANYIGQIFGRDNGHFWFNLLHHMYNCTPKAQEIMYEKESKHILQLMLIDPSLVCLFCGNELKDEMDEWTPDKFPVICETLKQLYEQNAVNPEGLTVHDISTVLNLRQFFAKLSEKRKKDGTFKISVCKIHYQEDAHYNRTVPSSFIPTADKMMNPRLYDQVCQSKAQHGEILSPPNLQLYNKWLDMMKLLGTRMTFAMGPPGQQPQQPQQQQQQQQQQQYIQQYQQQQMHFAQFQRQMAHQHLNLQQQQMHPNMQFQMHQMIQRQQQQQFQQHQLQLQAQQAPHRPIQPPPQPKFRCDFCWIEGISNICDPRLMIRLSNQLPIEMTRQFKRYIEKNMELNKKMKYFEAMRNDVFICIRHFFPKAIHFNANKMEIVSNTTNQWLSINIGQSEIFNQDFVNIVDHAVTYFSSLPNLVSGLIVTSQLKKIEDNCKCMYCNRKVETSLDVEIHKIHKFSDVSFCFICMEMFAGTTNEAILGHFYIVHRIKEKTVHYKLACPIIPNCTGTCEFPNLVQFRYHLSENHSKPEVEPQIEKVAVCGMGFLNDAAKNEHNRKHLAVGHLINEIVYEHHILHAFQIQVFCKICGMILENRNDWIPHFNMSHIFEQKKCKECNVVVTVEHVNCHMTPLVKPNDYRINAENFDLIIRVSKDFRNLVTFGNLGICQVLFITDRMQIFTIEEYFEKIDSLTKRDEWKNAEKIAKLISLDDEHSKLPFLHIEAYGSRSKRARIYDESIDELVCLHLHVLYNIYITQDFILAHSTQSQIIQLFNKEILQKRKEENWFLPIFYQICTDLRYLSKEAEKLSSGDDEGEANISFFEGAANVIMECYRTCVSDVRADLSTTKKVAMLNMTNQLFRIYFKINKLNLLKPLIRAIDNSGPLQNEFSMADKVAYNYFLGRKAMFDADLPLAEKSLLYAFRNCPTESMSNKRKILIYLIPVKMFLGHMPSSKLLNEFHLDEFEEVVNAVKDGNLALLDAALGKNETFFIQSGIFLMLEKLRMITFRTLFKKVSSIVGGSQIPLDAFLTALKFVGVVDIDTDELECIIANLIATKKIKGYLSHQHGKLVVSKTNAFPNLSTITAS
ncbi:unnamed protein product [Caenorhabditis angaria]|uniref:PCI domain-containing protein 2 homolog n=1 Tax=Caenorhabditis angaria TaxID=860376 RepID=A0A9P1N2F7_9PELO|nr:unnamed protein product [Caenorhabditis angaria]